MQRVVQFLTLFRVGSDWVDPDDPTVIAENELLGAAASIDAAAKKLASLRPRKNVKVGLNVIRVYKKSALLTA